jgi:hypothetical protein
MRTQHSDLCNALAKPPAMQVVEVSGVNGAGVLRAGLVLTACGLCHVFGQPFHGTQAGEVSNPSWLLAGPRRLSVAVDFLAAHIYPDHSHPDHPKNRQVNADGAANLGFD